MKNADLRWPNHFANLSQIRQIVQSKKKKKSKYKSLKNQNISIFPFTMIFYLEIGFTFIFFKK